MTPRVLLVMLGVALLLDAGCKRQSEAGDYFSPRPMRLRAGRRPEIYGRSRPPICGSTSTAMRNGT